MNAPDGRAMFELQLELHSRATGRTPNISTDELLEVHEALETFTGDFNSLFGLPRMPGSDPIPPAGRLAVE